MVEATAGLQDTLTKC